jgi:hypothetical protein
MTRKNNNKIISVVHPICCGLDVHKDMVSACIIITEKRIRQIRELVMLRKSYIKSLADYKRRVHKLFATSNIKIGSVVSDLFGKTGRNLIAKLIDTDTELKIEHVEQCAEGSLKQKVAELLRAIQGFFEAAISNLDTVGIAFANATK